MKKVLRVLPLIALMLVGVDSSTSAATTTNSLTTSRIPQEWWEGWNAGRTFVASVNAQYGAGSIQSRNIFQAEVDAYLPEGASFSDMEDGWDKGYVYALLIALR